MARPKGPTPSLRSQWLGEKLRDLRKGAGITQDEAAEYLQRTAPMLSRFETGEAPIRRGDVLGLLTLYGVSDEETREGLLQLCDDIWRKDWWNPYQEDVTKDFINVPWLESRADEILVYEQLVVHGLLQTREYAENVVRGSSYSGTSEEQITRWVDLRMERQKILDADRGTKLTVLLEEYVLQRPIGTSEVLARQLEHLLAASQDERIRVRIVSASRGPHLGQPGSFVLYEMSEPYQPVANVETVAGSLYVEQPAVSRIQDVWEDLNERAFDEDASYALIRSALEGISR